MPKHIEFAIEGRGYSLFYDFIEIIYNISENIIYIAIMEATIVVITWLLATKYIGILVSEIGFLTASFWALPITFLTGIYIPYVYEFFIEDS